ncbi:MAG: [FeFe] hydrogenase H-cluster maturation GTPase HydF [Desulfovibrionaceae bacterium]|nr:[FeFe] hydrogenase H-cluster maturation GTPase HydF [Desulfovibrionaceae bacterium]
MSSLNDTPRSGRIHIVLAGRRNAGKSSLINSLTGHRTAIVSDVAGTTTDPVYKSMEIHGLGPCVLVDTAGIDDEGGLGRLRLEKTAEAADKADIIILVVTADSLADGFAVERRWLETRHDRATPRLIALTKADLLDKAALEQAMHETRAALGEPVPVSSRTGEGRARLVEALLRLLPADAGGHGITGRLAGAGDVVLLIMPQDIQAPKGRLILPQVQTLRELLDKQCVIMSAVADRMDEALAALSRPPRLIITDSQVFASVYAKKPPESRLTSFSVLMAGYKGDLPAFIAGARALDSLGPDSRVLIAEACTHAPLAEDIGREKIPALLRGKYGAGLHVDVVSGTDFPADLRPWDLIIHCGGCMFNRAYMLSRVRRAREQGVPITNYGVALAALNGILDRIDLP